MAKIKGWERLDVDIYRRDKDLFGNYLYLWVDARNNIHVFETIRKVDKLALPMIEHSTVTNRFKTQKEARAYALELRKGLSN